LGISETPMLLGLPENVQRSLGESVPFPKRLGRPEEYALLVRQILDNPMLTARPSAWMAPSAWPRSRRRLI
jgi:hypothetical protein